MRGVIYKLIRNVARLLPHFVYCKLKSRFVEGARLPKRTFIEYLNDHCPDFRFSVLDIGARFGLSSSGLGALANLKNLQLVGIEPDVIEAARLEAATGVGSYNKIIPVAVWDRPGVAEIHITQCVGCTSRLEPDEQLLKPYRIGHWFSLSRKNLIEFTTLNQVLDPNSHFDIIKMDVQGGEYEVMMGGERYLDSSVAILLETHFVPIYKNQSLFDKTLHYCRQLGFRLIKLEIADVFDGEVVEANCVFIKDSMASIKCRDDLLKHLLVAYTIANWKYCEFLLRNLGRSMLTKAEFGDLLRALAIDIDGPAPLPEIEMSEFR